MIVRQVAEGAHVPTGDAHQGRGRGSSARRRDWCLGLGTAPGRGRECWHDRQNVTVEAAGTPERGPLETRLCLRAARYREEVCCRSG